MNYAEEEPGLMELVKNEAALLVKEEGVEDGRQNIADLQCGPSTSTVVGSTNVFDRVADPGNTLNIKEELGAIDVGPTVLQPMDTPGTTNQKYVGVVKQEHTINHKNLNPILSGGVKEGIVEDKWRGSRTPQDSLMEQPGACTALHSLHKKCLETVCTVQLGRLDIIQCDICDAVYIDAHKLLQHVQEVHGPGPKRSLDRRVKSLGISNGQRQCGTITSPVVHTCEYCHKAYASKLGLFYHIDVVHTKALYRCSECNKEYNGKHLLQKHIKKVHSKEKREVSSPVVHTCDYCHKTYTSKSGLIYHIDVVHTKVLYRCSGCNNEYKSKYLLQTHIKKVHSKEEREGSKPRIYTCDYCKKIFYDKGTIRGHIARVHSSGSYKCHQCNTIFKCKDYLMGHKTRVHPAGSKPRIYTCDYCKKMFTDKGNIRLHIAHVHSSGSYKCHQCNQIFKCKPYLMTHKSRLHPAEGRLRHTCTNCGQYFKSKWHCQQHEKSGKCARPTAGNTSAVASTSRQQRNVVIVKEEPADGELELGPVVFQHMDCNYRPYKQEPGLD